MANEVVIKVVSRNETAAGFLKARKDVEKFADDSADVYTKRFASRMETLGRNLTTPLLNSGKDMGERLGNSSAGEITRTISERITEELPKAINRSLTENNTTVVNESREAGKTIGHALGTTAGDTAGEDITERITKHIRETVKSSVRHVGEDASGDSTLAGDRIGRDISDTIHKRITEKIKTSVDVDTSGGLRGRSEKLGDKIGDDISDGIGGSLSTFFSGDLISLLVKVLAGGALAVALAPIIGGAVSSAVLLGLGGGVLGAGIAGAFKDPKVKGAFDDLKKMAGDALTAFGKPFRGPLLEFFEGLAKYLKTLGPSMKILGDTMAPILGQLGTGFIGLLQNAMPGILDAVKASAPLFKTLADHLPAIGQALGDFFRDMGEHAPETAAFFGDLLTAIEKIIIWTGKLVSAFAGVYGTFRRVIKNGIALFGELWAGIQEGLLYVQGYFWAFLGVVLNVFQKILMGAAVALQWVPGLAPKLDRAVAQFEKFRKGVNDQMNKIAKTVTITVRMRIIGLAAANAALDTASILKGMGYAAGGIKGAASGMVAGGLSWVGERGPELVNLPTGSTVRSSGDSMRMMKQGMDNAGGGGGGFTLDFAPSAGDRFMDAVVENLRYRIGRSGGGSTQRYLGRAGVKA